MPLFTRFRALVLTSALVGGAVGYAWQAQGPTPPAFAQATHVLADRPAVPEAPLTRDTGDAFALGDLKGQWVWLYMGYASCPDACPTALGYMAQEYGKLKAPERVKMVFLSVDARRDTPEKLGGFVRYFHPGLIGATGETESLDRLTRGLGATYIVPKAKPGADYAVGHPNLVFVVDPEGRLAAVYEPHDDSAGALARDFNALPNQAS